jgi:hypothetical protein
MYFFEECLSDVAIDEESLISYDIEIKSFSLKANFSGIYFLIYLF